MTTKHTLQFAGFDDWVEIFRTGEQTDSQGNTRTFTTADLDSMVTNHQSSPIVIGHPQTDDPAWGWSSALKRVGDSLFGKYADVQPAFAKMVENKQFPERSIKIKPVDNGYQLVHTGFLGAVPPAVEGLAQMQFHHDDQCLEFSSDWYVTSRLSRIFRRMKNLLIEDKGEAKAEEILPEYELESLSDAAVEQRLKDINETESVSGSFNQVPKGGITVSEFTQQQLDDAVAKATADAKASAEQEYSTKLASALSLQRQADAMLHVDQLLSAQKLVPAQISGLAEFMATLDDADENAFEFSVGTDDKSETKKQSQQQFFSTFLDSLPEHGLLDKKTQDEFSSDGAYMAPADSQIDAERYELHTKALAYQKQNQGVDYISAVRAVEQEA